MMLSKQKLMLAFLFLAMPMTNSLYAHFEHPSPDMYFSALAFSSRGADPELSITIQVLQNAITLRRIRWIACKNNKTHD